MDIGQWIDIGSRLTLTAALVVAVGGFFLGLVLSKTTVAVIVAGYERIIAMLTIERDQWRATAEAAQRQRDAADERGDRQAQALELAYRIIVRNAQGLPNLPPGPRVVTGADEST